MKKQDSVIGSLFYKFSERVSVKAIAFVISIILARLIEPAIFGLLAIITVFNNLAQVFVQGGLNVALIQNKDTKEEDYSTVFWISLCVAILANVIVFFLAPFIAAYYKADEIIMPLRFLSISMVFGAFNSVQVAKLSREMQFKKQMICNLISTVLAGIIGVILAYQGFGLWALIWYNFLTQAVACIAMLTVVNWFPHVVFSAKRAKTLVGYGWKILFSNLIYSLYTDIRSLVIGKVYTAKDLALYDRGNQLPNMVSYNLETAVQSVMFPALSKKQGNIEQIKSDLSKSIRMTTYIISPILIGIAAVSKPFVLFFLSEKWIMAVPYMIIFCIGYIFMPISGLCNVSIKAIGRADVFAKNQTVRIVTLFLVLLISLFAFKNVIAIAVGYATSLFLEMIIAMWPAQKYIRYTYLDVIKDVAPAIILSAIMGVIVYTVSEFIPNNLLSLIIGAVTGVVTYIVLSVISKNKAFFQISGLIKRKNKDENGNSGI